MEAPLLSVEPECATVLAQERITNRSLQEQLRREKSTTAQLQEELRVCVSVCVCLTVHRSNLCLLCLVQGLEQSDVDEEKIEELEQRLQVRAN